MGDDLVRVYAAPTVIDAQLVKGRLETDGIPVLLKGEGEGPYRLGAAELFVPSTFEQQARLIVESLREAAEDEAPSDDGTGRDDEPENG